MAGVTDRLISSGLRRGLRRGVLKGERVWLYVGAAALGARALQRFLGPGSPIVVTESLKPGETLVIRHLPPPD